MNHIDATGFIRRLTAPNEGALILNDDQTRILRRALEAITPDAANRAIINVYGDNDRMRFSPMIQALKAAATAQLTTTIPWHLPTCGCAGTGWVDTDPTARWGREYGHVVRCDANHSRPVTPAEWFKHLDRIGGT